MKKMILAAATMAAVSVFAELSVASLTTEGANDGKGWSDTSGNTSYYTAYLCTVDAAKTYFGNNSAYDTITAYLSDSAANYNSGIGAITDKGTKLDTANGYYADGAYTFDTYFQPGSGTLADGHYIALITYASGEDSYFRVFQSTASGEHITFDPEVGGGHAGDWTPASVPEPTSGLLLLLGVAGLALRRRRA